MQPIVSCSGPFTVFGCQRARRVTPAASPPASRKPRRHRSDPRPAPDPTLGATPAATRLSAPPSARPPALNLIYTEHADPSQGNSSPSPRAVPTPARGQRPSGVFSPRLFVPRHRPTPSRRVRGAAATRIGRPFTGGLRRPRRPRAARRYREGDDKDADGHAALGRTRVAATELLRPNGSRTRRERLRPHPRPPRSR